MYLSALVIKKLSASVGHTNQKVEKTLIILYQIGLDEFISGRYLLCFLFVGIGVLRLLGLGHRKL